MVLNQNVVCFMCPTLRPRTNGPPQSLALGARRVGRPPCQSIAVSTLVLSTRPLGDSWAAFKKVNPQKNLSRKVSW